jgi:hypothetical protein
VFFPTLACKIDPDTWRIPIHGWIYQPTELSRLRRGALHIIRRLLRLRSTRIEPAATQTEAAPMQIEASATHIRRRLGAFLADNERNQKLEIELAGRVYALRKSRPDGHFHTEIDIPLEQLPQALEGQWLTFRALTRDGDARAFEGRTLLMPPQGLSIISDIDDTIKITEVADRRRMLHNTFAADFTCVAGMSQLYQRWSLTYGAAFHYVSGSPWHLFPFLTEFLAAQGFPEGSFHLRDFRLMPRDLRRSLRSSAAVKSRHINHLLQTYPHRRFLLVGDSGESDAEIYARAARAHPGRVQGILIRNVIGAPLDPVRCGHLFAGLPRDLWQVFDDPAYVNF